MKRGLALSLLLLAACGGAKAPGAPSHQASLSPATYTMHGTIQGVSCDVADSRAQVIQVFDEAGDLIGQGRSTQSTEGNCSVFQTFKVSGLPRAKFYRVDIGQRKGPSYSFADLESKGWAVALKYGF